MQCALRLWRAVVWHGSCANILSRFRPGPGNHDGPPRYDMISGDLFFLALKLHRLTLSVDLPLIEHNIPCAHHHHTTHRQNPPERPKVQVLHTEIGLFLCCRFVIKMARLVSACLQTETSISSRVMTQNY